MPTMLRLLFSLAAMASMVLATTPAMAADVGTWDVEARTVNAIYHSGPTDETGNGWLPGVHRVLLVEGGDEVFRTDGVVYLDDHFINVSYYQLAIDQDWNQHWDFAINGSGPYESFTADDKLTSWRLTNPSLPATGCSSYSDTGECEIFEGIWAIDLIFTGVGTVERVAFGDTSGIPGTFRSAGHWLQWGRAADVSGTLTVGGSPPSAGPLSGGLGWWTGSSREITN